MATVERLYTAAFKAHVLSFYKRGARGCGARAIASRFGLPDAKLVQRWARERDERGGSLERKVGSGRKRKLTDEESTEHIKDFVVKKNKAGISVSYKEVAEEVKSKTGKDVSARTVRRLGREDHKLTDKFTTRKLAIECKIIFPLSRSAETCTLRAGFGCIEPRHRRLLERGGRSTTSSSASGSDKADLHRPSSDQGRQRAAEGSGTEWQAGHGQGCHGQALGIEGRCDGRDLGRRTRGAQDHDA